MKVKHVNDVAEIEAVDEIPEYPGVEKYLGESSPCPFREDRAPFPY